MSWRVGSKTGVTLFKGDELYGILLDKEKAAVVASMLNLADRRDVANLPEVDWLLDMAWGVIANCGVKVSGGWPDQDPEWVAAAERWRDKYHEWLDVRYGTQAGGGQAEGGAEGDLAADVPVGGVGVGGEVGAGHGGGCTPGCYCRS